MVNRSSRMIEVHRFDELCGICEFNSSYSATALILRFFSVKEKLGYFIQDRTTDLGHSSAEDARATLEVLKWKVRDDATPIQEIRTAVT
jgi:hypothetical protein